MRIVNDMKKRITMIIVCLLFSIAVNQTKTFAEESNKYDLTVVIEDENTALSPKIPKVSPLFMDTLNVMIVAAVSFFVISYILRCIAYRKRFFLLKEELKEECRRSKLRYLNIFILKNQIKELEDRIANLAP